MKKVLGLDLGTTSIGWALVHEAENEAEKSEIVKTGVRVVPLSTDEVQDFQKGKSISTNAARTLKRGMRRNVDRYQLRRDALKIILSENGILDPTKPLAETGKNSTHQLIQLRAKAASEQIALHDFARVLFAINKKRGYKSNRKAKDEGDGMAIDDMELALKLYHDGLTPGQYVLDLLKKGKKYLPDFYRSDLQDEFNSIWEKQSQFYPDILKDELKKELLDKSSKATWAICQPIFEVEGSILKGSRVEKKKLAYEIRVKGLVEKLSLEELIVALQEINGQISKSSGYLGKISDRSKELVVGNRTVGQYLYDQIKQNPHARLKNQVFYRQDYLNEFERIWEIQARHYPQKLTKELKREIRDLVIFYQRRLKSKKGLISVCELEGKEVVLRTAEKEGVQKKWIGPKVAPKSSLEFQAFKIWQNLNNLNLENTKEGRIYPIQDIDQDLSLRQALFDKLFYSGRLSAKEVVKDLVEEPKLWRVTNFEEIQGNDTWNILIKAFHEIAILSGHELDFGKMEPMEKKEALAALLQTIGAQPDIFEIDFDLEGQAYTQQSSYKFWHLLYSYEDDESKSGTERLIAQLKEKFGFSEQYGKVLSRVILPDDYSSLSSKAIRKILPFLSAGHDYSDAAGLAKYNHSHSLTGDENQKRQLEEYLELVPKNSLRNPVVEKILNQMVNLLNSIFDSFGKPDEIRVEMARELKKSAKERSEMTSSIGRSTRENNTIAEKLKSEFYPFNTGVRVTKNDILKYKLWKETDCLSVYTGKPIKGSDLFTKEYDIEHIIPKALLFDDSFSNKVLCEREWNRQKSNATAFDFLKEKLSSEEFDQYLQRVKRLYDTGKIKRAKYQKLIMERTAIPDGFIDRDLRNTQYIAKKSIEMLRKVCRVVSPTTGSITDKLREDWGLTGVLQELNWEKYNRLGLTHFEENKQGKQIPKITDWTKRNDHRHHAMDAITVAFTKPSHVQYFNYLNARRDENHKMHQVIWAIQSKETVETEKGKRRVKPPMPIGELKRSVKEHLEGTLVSFKAKNKVLTKSKNRFKTKKGDKVQETWTPRGQLHKETVYGSSWVYQTKLEKVGPKFSEEMIQKVARKDYRKALLDRLRANEGDPKKAFGGKNALVKTPIYLNGDQSKVLPASVKLVWKEQRYTIRKPVGPDLDKKKLEKVVDEGVKRVLLKRLEQAGGDPKKAFVNLEENPIWLNEAKGIAIKTVTLTGVSNATALHTKKDHLGRELLDKEGKPIPNDFVSLGNNHHVGIYRDQHGKLQERVVSFMEAVELKRQGLPVVDRNFNKHLGWEFVFSLKQNEYFVFPNAETGFDPKAIDLMDEKNFVSISPNLFRVQKFTKGDYFFRHHLETELMDKKQTKEVTWKRIGANHLIGVVKIILNDLGEIIGIGE